MITEVKMEVTPDLSERVQEIVFANGGRWSNSIISNKDVQHLDYTYLFIDNEKTLTCGNIKDLFEKEKFKEVSVYDFIVSRGAQEWLPKYNEEAFKKLTDCINGRSISCNTCYFICK